jgi:hypothetical protein
MIGREVTRSRAFDLATQAEFRVLSVARQLNQLRARRSAARLKFPMATNSMTMREARMEDIRNIITDDDTGEALRIILDVAVEYAQGNPELPLLPRCLRRNQIFLESRRCALVSLHLHLPGIDWCM